MRHIVTCVILSHVSWADAKPKARASFTVVTKSVKGKIPPPELDRFFAAHAAPLQACVARTLAGNPDLSALLSVELTFKRDGTLSEATIHESSLNDSDVESCLSSALVGMKWGAAFDGETTSK